MALFDSDPLLARLALLHQQRVAADVRMHETQGRGRADATREWHRIDDLYEDARWRWFGDLRRRLG